jgi:hypothetical protein
MLSEDNAVGGKPISQIKIRGGDVPKAGTFPRIQIEKGIRWHCKRYRKGIREDFWRV